MNEMSWYKSGRSAAFIFCVFLIFSCQTFKYPANYPDHDGETYTLTDAEIVRCDSVYIVAGDWYRANPIKRLLLGENYRLEWTTPVKTACLDMETEKGGLTPIRPGGGTQTTSLRTHAPDYEVYMLRSIDKNNIENLPRLLRPTFLYDPTLDITSTGYPYAAFALQEMAKAINIYYIVPELRYIPHTMRLGEFRETYGGMLVQMEIRPDDDMTAFKKFDQTENVIGSPRLYVKKRRTNKNIMDEEWLARSRLFDMLIGDWDRHEGQWRWAEFESERGGILFRPIPRDRDQAFVRYEGWVVSVLTAIEPKFTTFGSEVTAGEVRNLGYNARYFDRLFQTRLTLDDWLSIADSMKNALTDEVIENSVRGLPPEIFAISGHDLIRRLKARRDQLSFVARQHYLNLAEVVDVKGSDDDEYFLVERLDNERTRVTVFDSDDLGQRKEIIYQRTFLRSETREIHLHGLEGVNHYMIEGDVDEGIFIVVQKGDDKDIVNNLSTVRDMAPDMVIRRDFDIYERRVNF